MKILKVKCLAPTRLDNYLMQQFPALNPGRLNKALRENKIKLNGKKQPLSTRVMAGDEIKLFILDDVLDADKRVDGPAWKNARGPAQVVYDCPQILIVNKPAGLAVDGPDDDTLLNRALLYLNQQGEYKENDVYTPALCHRLDTGTSGLVIIAKTPEAEELFLAAIKSREVKKTYLCVTFGRPTPPDATLGGYLLKDADRGIVKIVEDKQPGAKDVETRYETIAVSGRLALLKVQLITGRTGFLQRAAARWAFSLDAPVTITSSSTSGHSSKARTLRSRTVSPPRSKLSLSNPIRVEEPAATRTAVTRHSNFLHLPHFIPALRRTAQSVLLFIEYYSVSTHKLQLPAPIKNAPVQHFWRCTGA